MEYLLVALSVGATLVVLADSRLRDPYFAFYELMPGMAIGDAAMRGDRRVRAAIIRRFGYGTLLGVLIAAIGVDKPIDGVAAGTVITVLSCGRWQCTVSHLVD